MWGKPSNDFYLNKLGPIIIGLVVIFAAKNALKIAGMILIAYGAWNIIAPNKSKLKWIFDENRGIRKPAPYVPDNTGR